MSMLTTLALRQLKHVEGLLAELDNPLAVEAQRKVHEARQNVEVLDRLDARNSLRNHVIGDRAA